LGLFYIQLPRPAWGTRTLSHTDSLLTKLNTIIVYQSVKAWEPKLKQHTCNTAVLRISKKIVSTNGTINPEECVYQHRIVWM